MKVLVWASFFLPKRLAVSSNINLFLVSEKEVQLAVIKALAASGIDSFGTTNLH